MSALFELLYREYCRAWLAEMQRQLLLINLEVPDGHYADSGADRAGDPRDLRPAYSPVSRRANAAGT